MISHRLAKLPQETHTIISNDYYVIKNCITFITNSRFRSIQYKIYDKFVQSIESLSVRSKVVNHLSDWIYNLEQILKESISKYVETGILRLEITFYIDYYVVAEGNINGHLDFLVSI